MITKVYDKKLKKEIINKYTGNSFKECLLRALLDGYIKVSDVKYLSVSGYSGEHFYNKQNYRLINKIKDKYRYIPVIKKESGCNFSMLANTKIIIKNGEATIYEEWIIG